MGLFSYFRRKKSKRVIPQGDIAIFAKAVLTFLALGLTDGIDSIIKSYNPARVEEFVIVSKAILTALKQGYDINFSNNFVAMSMKVNDKQKQIELTQLGRDVMISLDETTHLITSITLTEIYANLRKDIVKHPHVYGNELHTLASSFPDPSK